jgi:hypothetical protein
VPGANGPEAPLGTVETALQLLEPPGSADPLAIQPRAQERDAVSVVGDLGLDRRNLLLRVHDPNSDTE